MGDYFGSPDTEAQISRTFFVFCFQPFQDSFPSFYSKLPKTPPLIFSYVYFFKFRAWYYLLYLCVSKRDGHRFLFMRSMFPSFCQSMFSIQGWKCCGNQSFKGESCKLQLLNGKPTSFNRYDYPGLTLNVLYHTKALCIIQLHFYHM